MDIRYGKALPGSTGGDGEGKPDWVDLFSQLLLRTNGDVQEALEWLRRIAERQGWLDRDRTFEDVLDDLEEKGVIRRDKQGDATLTPRGDQALRESVFQRVFKGMGKGMRGEHITPRPGQGGERQAETRPYAFGDDVADLDFRASFGNALRRLSLETGGEAPEDRGAEIADGEPDWASLAPERVGEEDFEVHEREQANNCSTVLMLDISHSMILYGEDRITPAKMVAMSLVEFVRRNYPRDTIDVITFGDEAKEIPADRIAYVGVGPFHTNTCDGLRLAQNILRRRKNGNKQIFMVTDGKPSAVFDRGRLYRNSFGLDPLVLSKTFAEARSCRKSKIRVNTFMIAKDPYLIEFVENFSKVCGGKAFYTGLDALGELIFVDYAGNRKQRLR
jgi:Ca-activated chloride channel family protein